MIKYEHIEGIRTFYDLFSFYKGEVSDLYPDIEKIIINTAIEQGWEHVHENDQLYRKITDGDSYSRSQSNLLLVFKRKGFLFRSEILKTRLHLKGSGSYNCFYSGDEREFVKVLNVASRRIMQMAKERESKRQEKNKLEVAALTASLPRRAISTYFIDKIRNNQSKLEQSVIANLMKVYSFYEKQVSTYNILYDNISAIDFYQRSSYSKEEAFNKIITYSAQIEKLEATQDALMDAFEVPDMVVFYSIYNKFDEVGLFIKGGERAIIDSLHSLNQNMNHIISAIDDINATIQKLGHHLLSPKVVF